MPEEIVLPFVVKEGSTSAEQCKEREMRTKKKEEKKNVAQRMHQGVSGRTLRQVVTPWDVHFSKRFSLFCCIGLLKRAPNLFINTFPLFQRHLFKKKIVHLSVLSSFFKKKCRFN